MCTAIKFNDRFFGRTFDYHKSYGEELIILPRGAAPLLESENRYALMGVGVSRGATPMLFDGVNEWGLVAAALNFPGYAVYRGDGDRSIHSGMLTTLVLGLCRSVDEARGMLEKLEISSRREGELPPSPLHWIIADGREAMVVEPLDGGLCIKAAEPALLTNAPDYSFQLTRLADFPSLTAEYPSCGLGGIRPYSMGMGAMGLPGDFSSASRFVRGAFVREHTELDAFLDTEAAVNRVLSAMAAVSVPHGCVLNREGEPSFTRYTVAIDMESPAYYITDHTCHSVRGVGLEDRLTHSGKIIRMPFYGMGEL